MIHTFIERLWASLQIRKGNTNGASHDQQYTQVPEGYLRAMKAAGKEELRLYRLEQHCIAHFLTAPDQSSWLSFYLYEQADLEAFIILCEDSGLYTEEQRRGILLSIAPCFLSGKMSSYLSSLKITAGRPCLPFAVTNKQKEELHGIIDKIESLIECDYLFRKEYIQELVMQLVHFLLKRSDSFPQQPQLMISQT